MQINLRLFVTGDLAFIAMTLGKENSAGQHCFICDAKKADWQSPDHQSGKHWTLEDRCAKNR